MTAVVLESEIGSEYEDSPNSYEFPARYLRFFERSRTEPQIAVIYEPRGEKNRGRMSYVAIAEIVGAPEETGRSSKSGAPLWRVRYRRPAEQFPNPVPREVLGDPLESWLRPLSRGRARNVATVGRAVRLLSDADLERILVLAGGASLDTDYPLPDPEPYGDEEVARERVDLLIRAFVRAGSFRSNVLGAYEYRCAMTGLGIGSVAPTKSQRLLDAAHIRAVQSGGPDVVSNGLPLTPTVHRMFDAGLVSATYEAGRPVLLVSGRLEGGMISVPDRGVSLSLQTGTPLILPRDRNSWPSPAHLAFHRERVFSA